jgi:hypothetical protein
MNINTYTEGWSTSSDPNVPAPPPPLPVRADYDLPMTVGQVMALADLVAHV